MKNLPLRYLVELNVALLLVSTSGALGKYVQTPPALTIWWRAFFAFFCLIGFILVKKINFKIASKDRKTILLSGLLMGAHWVTYFYALQLSNVAIGMLAMFTYPVITVLLEPLFFKIKLQINNVLLGFLIVLGIYFLAPEFSLENNQTKGVLFGIVSALFYSLRNIMMKQKVNKYHGSTLMAYQMLIMVIFLVPVLFIYPNATFTSEDWLGLAALAILTTSFGHTLFVISMKHFSISAVSIISSIQPVYGILFGFLFLGEIPSVKTFLGGTLIILTVVIKSLQTK